MNFLFLGSFVLLFLCSFVPLFLFSVVPLFLCSFVPLLLCSFILFWNLETWELAELAELAFRESSYAYLLIKNGTSLTTITSTTSIHKGKATTATINTKKTPTLFLLVTSKGKVFTLLEGLESSFWGQIGVEFNFQSTGPHYRCFGRILSAH